VKKWISPRWLVALFTVLFTLSAGLPGAHAALQAPTFASVRVQIVSDNSFDLFLGNSSGITSVFYENQVSWGDQITAASVLDVVPNPGDTYLYVMAMGGGGTEDWGGYLNYKDFITYPGAQVVRDASPIGSGIKGASYLDVGNYITGFHDHQQGCTSSPSCDTVENGGFSDPNLLADAQAALNGAIWGSATYGDAGVPYYTSSGVCCSSPLSGKGWSMPSNSAIMYRYPLGNAGLPLTPGNGQVTMNWIAPSSGDAPAGYMVYYKLTSDPDSAYLSYGPIASGTTSAVITGLTNGNSYSFKVAALDSGGTPGPESQVRSSTPNGPPAPTNVSYVNNTSSVAIAFTPPSTSDPIYSYGYSTDGGTTWRSLGIAPTASTATITLTSTGTALLSGVSYPFTIRAYGAMGDGASSVPITMTRYSQTISFSALTGVALSAGTVTLGITPGEGIATASSGLPVSYSTSTPAICSIASDGNIALLAGGSCAVVASQPGDSTYPAAPNVTVNLMITQIPGQPIIKSISTRTLSGTPATCGATGSAYIVFTDNVTNGSSTQYLLSAVSSTETITSTVTRTGTTNSNSITGLTIGHTYTISVTEINSLGSSLPAIYSDGVTPTCNPYAVSNLKVTESALGRLTVNFTRPTNLNGGSVTSYKYFITPHGSSFSDTPTYTTSPVSGRVIPPDPGYSFTGLDPTVSYDIKVVVSSAGSSSTLAQASAIVNQIAIMAPNAPLISISGQSPSVALVNWYANGDNGSAITSFTPTVLVDGAPVACTFTFSAISGSCPISSLLAGQAVNAAVFATDALGLTSITANATTFVISGGTPPAPTSIPDPVQQSSISGITPNTSVPNPSLAVQILGTFIERVVNIDLGSVRLPAGSWTQSANSISLTIDASAIGNYSFTLYNGAVPILVSPAIAVSNVAPTNSLPTIDTVTATNQTNSAPAPTKTSPTNSQNSPMNPATSGESKSTGPLSGALVTKVFFDMGSYKVKGKNLDAVAALAPQIAGLGKEITIKITGYAQPTPGSEATDGALSEHRAAAIAQILRSAGVNTRVEYQGAGRAKVNLPTSRYVEIVATNR